MNAPVEAPLFVPSGTRMERIGGIVDNRLFLKVKIKSLAAEARIIRNEERKPRNADWREGLHNHRIEIVRRVARHTLLAYGFLRGLSREQIEPHTKDPVRNWDAVAKMVNQYGPRGMSAEDRKVWDKRWAEFSTYHTR